MASQQRWQFTPDELPRWATPPAPPQRADAARFPAPTPPREASLLVRLLGFRLLVAVGFLALVALGAYLHGLGRWLESFVSAFLLGTLLGVIRLVNSWLSHAHSAGLRNQGFKVQSTHPPLQLTLLLWPALLLPGAVAASWCVYILFEERFYGLLLLVPLTYFTLWQWGSAPVAMKDSLLNLEPAWNIPRPPTSLAIHRPDLPLAASLFLIVWLVPALASNTVAIALVTVVGLIMLGRTVYALRRYADPVTVLAALLTRGGDTLRTYLDYDPRHVLYWRPHEKIDIRGRKAWTALGLVDLLLLVGLGYFCPWELFAKLTLSDFRVDALLHPQYPLDEFRWLVAPVVLVGGSEVNFVYLLTFVVAILGFLFLPPLCLLVIYLPRLVELEQLAQHCKQQAEPVRPVRG